jgi:hypothetical protein
MAKNQTGKTENAGNDSAPHDETAWDPLEDEKAEKEKTEPAKPPKLLNLTRFLQERPQPDGIRALLNAKYRRDVKALTEWETALGELLNKKTK